MFVHKRTDVDIDLIPTLRDGVHRVGRLDPHQGMSLQVIILVIHHADIERIAAFVVHLQHAIVQVIRMEIEAVNRRGDSEIKRVGRQYYLAGIERVGSMPSLTSIDTYNANG